MPYRLRGLQILHKKGGKWKVKQVATSRANALKTLRLLRGLESGSIKPSEVGKGKFAKKKRIRKLVAKAMPTKRKGRSKRK